MKTRNSQIARIVLVVVLVAALAVPSVALASPRAKETRAKIGVMAATAALGVSIATGQPEANLQKRISNVIRAREKRFDAAEANIEKRIERLRSLATSVGAETGADVTGVMTALDEAQAHLDSALAKESAVATALVSISSTATVSVRHQQFVDARSLGRASVAELKEARRDLKDALHALRGIVRSVKTEDATEPDDE